VPRRARWCLHVRPATATVDCNGEPHRVTWRRGKLILEDHDLAAERAILAFGGRHFPCLNVLTRWRGLHSWAMSSQLLRQMEARLQPGTTVMQPELAPLHELGLLLTWERRWRRERYFSEHGRLLAEQFRRRALAPFREHLTFWKQQTGARLLSTVKIDVLRPEQSPAVRGSINRVKVTATAAVNVRWVLDVWARGLAVVDKAFVLGVIPQGGPGGRLEVRAVRWREEVPGTWMPVTSPAQVSFDPIGTPHLGWEHSVGERGWAKA
jgi:hypothetical protein